MRRGAGSVCLSVLLAMAGVSPARADPAMSNQVKALQAAAAAAQGEDCKTALGIVAAETAKPGFERLPDQVRAYFYQIGASCASEQQQFQLGARYAEAATRLSEAPAFFWQGRFLLTWQAGRVADAVTALEDTARANPEALNAFPSAELFQFNQVVGLKEDENLRRRLLAVLTAGYVPPEAGVSIDWMRRDYAAILAQAGDTSAAAALVSQIDTPGVLISISLDPRLRDMVPAPFDARTITQRHMARSREVAAAHAGTMGPQLNVAHDLLLLGRPEESLAALDAIEPGKSGNPTFQDEKAQLNWWWDARARAYSMLGRYDDAVEAFTQGKSLDEHGQPNISQTINLAATQVRHGHYGEALATLAPIREGKVKGSTFGMMQYRSVQGCANFLTGKTDDAQADTAYVRDHAKDAPAALTDLLICAGDLDGAAASLIERLDTPDQRADALMELSDFVSPPATYPEFPGEAALQTVKARKDVQAAISRAGGTRSFNVLRRPT